jgi:polysaccharide biosynthesis/export protein
MPIITNNSIRTDKNLPKIRHMKLNSYSRQIVLFLLAFSMSKTLTAQIPPLPIIDPTKIVGEKPIKPSDAKSDNGEKALEMKTVEDKVKTDIETEKDKIKKEEEEKDILAKKRLSTLPEAKIWGQNFFRDQSISLFDRTRDLRALPSYLLNTGDELSVTVWGVVDFSKAVSIGPDGYIDLSIPTLMIPRLYVKGMKFGDVYDAIKERLANHMNMRGSFIDIQLNYSRNISINITGEVFNPGSYSIPAVNTAFNALVAAGGPSQIGSVRTIKVVSSTKPIRVLDIYKFATNPNVADEFFMSNNDYIFVPLAGRVVEVKGAVKRPYYYELIDGENLREVLQYAGGLAADAYLRNIQVRRYSNNEESIIDIDLGDLLRAQKDFMLLNGDIITISPIKEAYSNYVTVQGAVKLPGEYELKPSIKIKDVLLQAGIMLSAVKDRIYVKRIQPDFSIKYININVDSIMMSDEAEANIYLRALDDIEVKFKSDFVDEYTIKLNGAVRKPGMFRHSDSLSLADLIYLGNGIKNEAALSLVEISRLVQKEDGTTQTVIQQFTIDDSLNISGADEFLLKPYDQIFVRLSRGFELPKNVEINGEIFFPGTYTIKSRNERVSDLITRAGGFTEIAFLEGAQLYRQGEGFVILNLAEIEKDSNSRFNYLLKEGDQITVPKIKDLVTIAGRVNHPYVKEKSEIHEIELKVNLMKLKTELEKEELLAGEKIEQMKNPPRFNVPYHKNKFARYYIKKYAGGIDRDNGGRKRLIFVRYADGSVKKTRQFLFFKSYPKVEKGAMVYVDTHTKDKKIRENRRVVDWNVVIKDSFAILTSGLTVYALIRAITAP